jgi:hypothetical protein
MGLRMGNKNDELAIVTVSIRKRCDGSDLRALVGADPKNQALKNEGDPYNRN